MSDVRELSGVDVAGGKGMVAGGTPSVPVAMQQQQLRERNSSSSSKGGSGQPAATTKPKERIRGSVAVSRKALGESTPPSIPTKFETILDYEKERDGFLTRTLRFDSHGTTKNSYGQGPGSYHHELPLIFQKESISKKGYGNGFVSKGARFHSNGDANSVLCSMAPGPGTYSMAMLDMATNGGVKGTKSSMFAPPVFRVGPPLEPTHGGFDPGPGPGSYKPVACPMYRGVGSAFRSGIKRFEDPNQSPSIQGAMNPAPGEYDVGHAFTPSDSRLQHASFRSKTDRLGHTNGGRQGMGPPSVIYSDKPTNTAAMYDTSPGPGSYDADKLTSIGRAHSRGAKDDPKMSSMFCSTSAGRFARGSSAPGPGTYDHHIKEGDTLRKGARSVFVSSSKRNNVSAAMRNAPGPAFYVPRQVGRKSFHINHHVNGQHRWV